jgi:DNA-binding transcriptional ArsR family regulator
MIVKQADSATASHPAGLDPFGVQAVVDDGGCARPPEACGAFADHAEAQPDSFPHLHAGIIGVLQALADPMRLAIVRRLAAGSECACGALGMPISKSTLTHHLHVLRAAGIIVQREEGTRRMTSLDRDGLERRFPGLLESVLAAPDQEAASQP